VLPRRRNGLNVVIAVIVALAGATFTAQGLGAPIARSFMIGDFRWAVIGVVLLGIAAFLAWRELGRSA
jgi:hypothetical protein